MKNSMLIHPNELSREWIDRLADAGVEAIGIHPYGGKKAISSLNDLLARLKTAEYRGLIDYARSRGLEVEYELHAAGYLLPRELFKTNPEYFRTNESGERTNDWNLCVSNDEAVELFAKNAVELALSLYGSSHDFYFWLDDGHGLYCHCPKCKELSPSDQQLLLVNRMESEIKKHMPDARVAYLAYMDTVVPPEKVAANDGVFLEYAPFEKYTAKGENAAELIAREREMLVSLKKFFSKQPAKVLEYWYDNSMYSNWKKPPAKFELDEATMLRDVAQYRKEGFDCISTFACFLGEDYENLYGAADIVPFADCVHRRK